MSTLEREVIEKFHQLDKAAQKRVRDLIIQETGSAEQADVSGFDYDAWWAEVETAQITLRPDVGGCIPTASELVNEVREERDADILHSLGLRGSTGEHTD